MIQDVIRTLIQEFPDNHGSRISPIPYFGVSPIPDNEKAQHKNKGFEKTPGEVISTYEPSKYISVDSIIGRTDVKGKTWASSSNAISYNNTNNAMNDPRYYYRFFYPSRDTLGVSNNGELVVVPLTPMKSRQSAAPIRGTVPSSSTGGGGTSYGAGGMGGGY